MRKGFIKKNDVILIAAAVAAAAVLFLCIHSFCSSNGDYALVEVDGKMIAELSLDEDTSFDIEMNGKVTNTLVISGGEVSVLYADCPDQICVKHKSISKNNESIICLPNRVIITIASDTENDVDGVAE